MTIYNPGCPDEITNPICSDCPPKELGDIRSFWLRNTATPFVDITDPTEWQALITSRDLFVFPYSNGGLEVTENEVTGYGNVETEADGYSFVMTVHEPAYVDNWGFWNSIKNSKNYHVGWRTENYIHESEFTVSIVPKAPIAEGDKKGKVDWLIIFKFEQEAIPRPFTTPADIFEVCIDVV